MASYTLSPETPANSAHTDAKTEFDSVIRLDESLMAGNRRFHLENSGIFTRIPETNSINTIAVATAVVLALFLPGRLLPAGAEMQPWNS